MREVAGRIVAVAKRRGSPSILVGHVTKDGSLAGPRVLEHLVDCVLQFEGERERPYRTVRAIKNRFGSTSEAGVFEMRQAASSRCSTPRRASSPPRPGAPGSAVLASMEGSRPLLVEVQALVTPSELMPAAPSRQRASTATAWRSCSPCSAVTAASRSGGSDVFVNVVGGVRVDEPGADLAVALAVASAARNVPLGPAATQLTPLAAFGELGLTGELRWVAHPERRLAEAHKFGLETVLGPPGSGALDDGDDPRGAERRAPAGARAPGRACLAEAGRAPAPAP